MSSFSVGDRCQIISKKKYSGEKGYVSGFHTDDSSEIWVKLDNHDLQIRVNPDNAKFLEDETGCNNSHNLTSAQELVQDSASLGCNADLTLLEPQRLTITAQASLSCDTQELTTTATCKVLPILEPLDCDQEKLISLQLLHPAPHSPQRANAGEVQTSEIVFPQSLKSSENYSPNLSPSKTSQDSLPAPITQDSPRVHISEELSEPLTNSGTMRNGWLLEADTLPVPSLESEYCWLRSPGALSLSGKGRPPGQTKQEAELKKLGLINKGEVLNPAILCQWYEIPDSWLDPLECRAATELLEECDRQQEIFSILESQPLPCNESSISTPFVLSQPPVTRTNAQPETYIINQSSYKVGRTETVTHPLCAESLGIIKDNLGFGFIVDWLNSERITSNWERGDRLISELAIAPQHLIDKFLEEKLAQSAVFSQGETLKAMGSPQEEQLCKRGCETTPEIFLEETQP